MGYILSVGLYRCQVCEKYKRLILIDNVGKYCLKCFKELKKAWWFKEK